MATVLFLLDLLGTFVFALSGATVAVRNRLDLFGVLVLSCAAAVSGGIARDLLVARTPVVLQAELYAVAALAGGGLVAIGHVLGVPQAWSLATGAGVCFGLRFMAIRYGWHLPVARLPE
ncbi:trimeric intracellular cation channel family protein [Xanthomonas codiaei]|uniref:Trimeric intracellular cation channel family protein n=1 Tax=Xanthomonas codiaei TaxID=56463 RepID=A0A2S7CJ32_9XANT|nr:TRIC cation channel family protein [Xanthomonas codiaei]PPU61572.1 hypothetical protein XcodCFBP4690_15750 [Xanthomonas codiaei]